MIALLLLMFVLLPRPARGNPGSGCVLATQGTQGGNHQGVRGDVWFGTNSSYCYKVVSVGVRTSTSSVEYGWVIGWLAGTNCDQQYHDSPTTFMFGYSATGPYDCKTFSPHSSGTFWNLELKDQNQNTVWNGAFNSVTEGQLNEDFQRGTLRTNGERHNLTYDGGFAHFKNLAFQVSGQPTWYGFSALQADGDSDPNFNFYKCGAGAEKVDTTNSC